MLVHLILRGFIAVPYFSSLIRRVPLMLPHAQRCMFAVVGVH
jgi:hypothetical protein